MSLPANVEHYEVPSGGVKLEVHQQQNGHVNYWLFAAHAAIELKEEDIGQLGEMLRTYNKEVINKPGTIELGLKRLLLGLGAVLLLSLIIQGVLL